MTAGPDLAGEPLRYRSDAAANLEAAPAALKATPLNVAAMQRVKQRSHQLEPLPFTSQVMGQDVFAHSDVR